MSYLTTTMLIGYSALQPRIGYDWHTYQRKLQQYRTNPTSLLLVLYLLRQYAVYGKLTIHCSHFTDVDICASL